MKTAIRAAFLLWFCFLAYADLPEKGQIIVTALADDGSVLRSGPAFLLEADNVICSYSVIEGATHARVEWPEGQRAADQLVAYSDVLKFAILKTEEDISLEPAPGISSIFSIGDTIYFLEKDNTSWKTVSGSIVGFEDSGVDLTIMHLRPELQEELFIPSPVTNTFGEFIGWLTGPGTAITPQTLYEWMGNEQGIVPLSEIAQPKPVWAYRRITPKITEGFPEFNKMTVVTGTRAFPFHMEIPEPWEYEGRNVAGRHFFRARDISTGICLDLHILPVQSNDLQTAIERMETLQFPELSRSEFIPYDTGNISGFRATYDDIGSGLTHSATVFYGISNKLFYVLSVSYPVNFEKEARTLIEQILSSLVPAGAGQSQVSS